MKFLTWLSSFDSSPYLAGSPPALVMGINLYKSVITAVGADWWFAAGAVGLLGVVGIISVEMNTYKMVARAFAEQQWGVLKFVVGFGLIITGMTIYAVYSGHDTRALVTSSVAMVIGYAALMAKTYMDTIKARKEDQLEAQTIETRNQVALLEAKAKIEREKHLQANAEARRAKAAASGGQSPVSGGQARTAGQARYDPEVLEKVVALLEASPNPETVSVRKIEEAGVGVKKTQASGYKSEALRIINERKAMQP